jgi:hypothetical protein
MVSTIIDKYITQLRRGDNRNLCRDPQLRGVVLDENLLADLVTSLAGEREVTRTLAVAAFIRADVDQYMFPVQRIQRGGTLMRMYRETKQTEKNQFRYQNV